MDPAEKSKLLFGRASAIRVYSAIAELRRATFTTGDIVALLGLDGSTVSRELAMLTRLDFVRQLSRRGDYARVDTAVWDLVRALASEWGIETRVSVAEAAESAHVR